MKGIRRYRDSDYPMILSWYASRGQQCPAKASLADMGWVADGRIAGWLYVTQSNVALIEGIIANPASVPSLRKESLVKLSGFLVDLAVGLGYTDIIAISDHPSIFSMARRLGFKEMDAKVFTLITDQDQT